MDGSRVGYIKDGKFVQTVKELPKLDPKKPQQKDPQYVARLKESQALLAIRILKQSAPYYKELAEDIKQTPAKRADAKTKYQSILAQIAEKEKIAGVAVQAQAADKAVQDSKSATTRAAVIKTEFGKLQQQREAVMDPKDPKIARIKAQQDALAKEYAKLYPVINKTKSVISQTAAFGILAGTLTKSTTTQKNNVASGPTGAQGPTGTPLAIDGGVNNTTSGTKFPKTPRVIKVTTKGSSGPTGATGPTGPDNSGALEGFRAAEAADAALGASGPSGASGASGPSGTVSAYDKLLAEVKAKYNLPDIIFSNVDSLGKILKKYINGEIDLDRFKQEIENDSWYRQNSTEIKARYLQKFNYEDLVKSGNAKGTTDYEMSIAKITNTLIKKARELGSALDEGQAKLIAEDLYIHNQDSDDAVVVRRLVSGIRPIAGMIAGKITEDYSGLALQNYQGLQSLAKANGFKLEDILPRGADGKPATAQETLQRLALGEIDPSRLAQDVRKLAAVGQPQFVRDLLGQGINLDTIYAPYRKTMSNILELDEEQIDLNDPTLRMGISDKGDVNLYDYSKSLRQDSRWQYTGNAREAVSDSALTVLRNFGFQG